MSSLDGSPGSANLAARGRRKGSPFLVLAAGLLFFAAAVGAAFIVLRPTTLLVSVLITVFYLQVFDEPYLVTDGGPLGSTQSMALYTYHKFGFGDYGMASASSYVLVVLVAVFSVIQFRSLRSNV